MQGGASTVIAKARVRLRSAAEALKALEQSADIETVRAHWYPFLSAWKAVLNVIEQGVKGNPKATKWYNEKKQQRKDDHLLTYLFHARNDEEHGLTPTIAESASQMLVSIPDVGVENRQISWRVNTRTGAAEPYRPDGGPLEVIQQHGAGPTLQVVRDRGVEYGPPLRHLGQPIDMRPLPIASAGLIWMSELVDEAEIVLNG